MGRVKGRWPAEPRPRESTYRGGRGRWMDRMTLETVEQPGGDAPRGFPAPRGSSRALRFRTRVGKEHAWVILSSPWALWLASGPSPSEPGSRQRTCPPAPRPGYGRAPKGAASPHPGAVQTHARPGSWNDAEVRAPHCDTGGRGPNSGRAASMLRKSEPGSDLSRGQFEDQDRLLSGVVAAVQSHLPGRDLQRLGQEPA